MIDKPRTMKWKGLTLTEYAPESYTGEYRNMPVTVAAVWPSNGGFDACVRLTIDPDEQWFATGSSPKRALSNAARYGLRKLKEPMRRLESFMGQRA